MIKNVYKNGEIFAGVRKVERVEEYVCENYAVDVGMGRGLGDFSNILHKNGRDDDCDRRGRGMEEATGICEDVGGGGGRF